MPTAFFSKGLTQPKTRYSAFDRKLLAVYLAVNLFSILLKDRIFILLWIINPSLLSWSLITTTVPSSSGIKTLFLNSLTTFVIQRHWELCCWCTVKNWDQCHTHRSVPYYWLCCHSSAKPELTQFDKTSLKLQAVPIPAINATIICEAYLINMYPVSLDSLYLTLFIL